MHGHIRGRFQQQKDNQRTRAAAQDGDTGNDHEMHGDNPDIGEKHQIADVRHPFLFLLAIVAVGEPVIQVEHADAYQYIEYREPACHCCIVNEKDQVAQVKEAVVQGKKPCGLALRFRCWFDGPVVDLETGSGELFQVHDPAYVEVPDDDALAPVDPHQDKHIPLLENRQHDRDQVGQQQDHHRAVGCKVSGQVD